MPADADVIRATIDQYLALFTAGDRDAWLDLWADGATMEDPVGTPAKTGRDEIGAFFDQSHTGVDGVELRASGPAIVVGSEAVFAFQARPTIGGAPMAVPVYDVMTFDDDGRIATQRAFVDFAMLGPAAD